MAIVSSDPSERGDFSGWYVAFEGLTAPFPDETCAVPGLPRRRTQEAS
jgi:hypothetical protein